jgi:hypothetical protein
MWTTAWIARLLLHDSQILMQVLARKVEKHKHLLTASAGTHARPISAKLSKFSQTTSRRIATDLLIGQVQALEVTSSGSIAVSQWPVFPFRSTPWASPAHNKSTVIYLERQEYENEGRENK